MSTNIITAILNCPGMAAAVLTLHRGHIEFRFSRNLWRKNIKEA
jgi:hypothetical protein